MEWWIWVLIIVGAVAVLAGIGVIVDLVRRKRLRKKWSEFEKRISKSGFIKGWCRPGEVVGIPVFSEELIEKMRASHRTAPLLIANYPIKDVEAVKKYSLTVAGAKISFSLETLYTKQAFPGAGKIIDSSIIRMAKDKYRAILKADAETIAKIKAEIPTSELYRIIVGKKTVVVDGQEKEVEVESAVEVGFDKKTLLQAVKRLQAIYDEYGTICEVESEEKSAIKSDGR